MGGVIGMFGSCCFQKEPSGTAGGGRAQGTRFAGTISIQNKSGQWAGLGKNNIRTISVLDFFPKDRGRPALAGSRGQGVRPFAPARRGGRVGRCAGSCSRRQARRANIRVVLALSRQLLPPKRLPEAGDRRFFHRRPCGRFSDNLIFSNAYQVSPGTRGGRGFHAPCFGVAHRTCAQPGFFAAFAVGGGGGGRETSGTRHPIAATVVGAGLVPIRVQSGAGDESTRGTPTAATGLGGAWPSSKSNWRKKMMGGEHRCRKKR